MSVSNDYKNVNKEVPPAANVDVERPTAATPPKLIKFARSYFKRGWGVVELYGVTDKGVCGCRKGKSCDSKPGKHPVDGGQFVAGSLDDIDALGGVTEPRNIGIATGKASGLFVLDVDPRNGGDKTLGDLEATHGPLPDCPTVETGGGGLHYFFAYPPGIETLRNGTNKLGAGLDIKGDGGYVVAAPSLHESGRYYKWLPGKTPKDVALPQAPQWLLDVVLAASPSVFDDAAVARTLASVPLDKRLTMARHKLAMLAPAIEGQGGDEITLQAASIGYGYGLEQAEYWPLLVEYNKRCVPPWDENGLADKLRNAYTYNDRPFGWRLAPKPGAVGDAVEGDTGGVTILQSSNEVDLAIRFLADLGTVKSDGATLYAYVPQTGAWCTLDAVTAEGMVQDYHDATIYGDDGETSKLKLTNAKTKATLACALRNRGTTDPVFFVDAPPGAAFRNGFVTIKDGQIEQVPHAPENKALSALSYDVEPNADFIAWDRLLNEVWQDEPDLIERKNALQEFAGACLLGVATRYARCLVLTGEGNNGKSTVMEILTGALFANKAVAAIPPQEWKQGHYVACLHGVKLNSVAELPKHEIFRSDAFKQIITGEQTTARHLYGKPFSFVPVAGHIFAANDLPTTGDSSEGFWRRILVLSFNRDFAHSKINKAELVARHLINAPAIAWWALIGAQRLLEQTSYTLPASHGAAVGNWKDASDPVRQWITDMAYTNDASVPPGPDDHPDIKSHAAARGVKCSDLCVAYNLWAKEHGHRSIGVSSFAKRLRRASVRVIAEAKNRWAYALLRDSEAKAIALKIPLGRPFASLATSGDDDGERFAGDGAGTGLN